jgi:lipid A ethanolaminephosphotransferase
MYQSLFLFYKRNKFVLLASLICVFVHNYTFFKQIVHTYPNINSIFVVSLGIVLFAITGLLLTLLCYRYTTKFVFILFVCIAAISAYYMHSYNIVIDKIMIQNSVQTNVKEVRDLLTWKMAIYIVFLAVIPCVFIFYSKLPQKTFKRACLDRLYLILFFIALIILQFACFSKNYTVFFREYKLLRLYANPVAPIYGAVDFMVKKLHHTKPMHIAALGVDAKKHTQDKHRRLTIFVLGETARADHFSLNGYAKLTNPLLAKERLVSFSNMESCGTSTGVSVPCLFSNLGRRNYNDQAFSSSENILDILKRTGVNVLWRDNNSDSKDVALRVPYQDYKNAHTNTKCDEECRDAGMLVGLQDYIHQQKIGDIFIVLHQMGSHGPAYYKRYPKKFEYFTPTCNTNLLEKCSKEQIVNTFDNTIAYTDFFLSEVIALLKQNTQDFQSMMWYVADHGESLGENGIYLHGMPYMIAPKAQKNPASIVWLAPNFEDIAFAHLQQKAHAPISHDYVFSSILGLHKIQTHIYNKQLDLFTNVN